jgi:hypothetical protein
MKHLELTDEQARVIADILGSTPKLVYDEAKYGGESIYALSMSAMGESLIVGFSRWGEQSITQTSQDDRYRMVANRIGFENGSIEKMDALCASWIQFRCKYLVPKVQEQKEDDELGDLDEHPF